MKRRPNLTITCPGVDIDPIGINEIFHSSEYHLGNATQFNFKDLIEKEVDVQTEFNELQLQCASIFSSNDVLSFEDLMNIPFAIPLPINDQQQTQLPQQEVNQQNIIVIDTTHHYHDNNNNNINNNNNNSNNTYIHNYNYNHINNNNVHNNQIQTIDKSQKEYLSETVLKPSRSNSAPCISPSSSPNSFLSSSSSSTNLANYSDYESNSNSSSPTSSPPTTPTGSQIPPFPFADVSENLDSLKEKNPLAITYKAIQKTPSSETKKRRVRRRLVWTAELHELFILAIEKLGLNAVPGAILKEMNVSGLTRENISSHLQKYRQECLRRQCGLDPATAKPFPKGDEFAVPSSPRAPLPSPRSALPSPNLRTVPCSSPSSAAFSVPLQEDGSVPRTPKTPPGFTLPTLSSHFDIQELIKEFVEKKKNQTKPEQSSNVAVVVQQS